MPQGVDRPYPGLRPFQQTDHDRFFGRKDETVSLAELWQGNRLTLAVGPVASGKTSLLNAGVLPLVTGKRADVLPPGRICYGSAFPVAALPEHNPYTLALLRSWAPDESVTHLAGMSVYDFVRRRAARHEGAILAPIDQGEELSGHSGPRMSWRRNFLDELASALHQEPRFHLLFLVRDEALGLISGELGNGAQLRLAPLSYAAAFEAITMPAERAGRGYDTGAAEALIADLRTSRILTADGAYRLSVDESVQPSLLQVVGSWLWASLPPEPEIIGRREVRRYGDVSRVLAAHWGQAIAAVAEDHDLPTTRLRSWLLGTFVTELGTRGAAYEGMADTAGLPNTAVRAFEDRHLLSAEARSGSRWYELLCDRLIEPLRQATDERIPEAEPADYLRAAERALALGEPDLAQRYAERILRASPGTSLRLRARARSLLGNLEYEREKPIAAESHFRAAASLFEAVRDTEAVARQLAAVGRTLLAEGRFEDVMSDLRAAVSRMPNDLALQTELGLALWQLGQGEAAVAVLTGVLGIDGGHREALRARGEILADLGHARAAMSDLDRVDPTDRPLTRAARGLATAKLGNSLAASQEISDALAEAPRNGLVLLYAARAEALSGQITNAVELARRAIDATDPLLLPHHRDIALRLIENPEQLRI